MGARRGNQPASGRAADTIRSRTRQRAILLLSGALVLSGAVVGLLPAGMNRTGEGSGRVERLIVRPAKEFALGTVRNHRLYGTILTENAFTLTTSSLTDRSPAPLARIDLRGYSLGQTMLTDTDAWVLVHPTAPPPAPTVTPPAPAVSTLSGGRAFFRALPARIRAEPPAPLAAGEIRQTYPRAVSRSPRPALLHRIPLTGGAVQTAELDTRGYRLDNFTTPYVLTPEGVFWVLPRATTYTTVRKADSVRFEYSPTDDLMLSSFREPARLWRSGIAVTSLSAFADRLSLVGLVRGISVEEERYLLSRKDARAVPSPIKGFTGNEVLVPYRDRLYWVEVFYVPDSESGEVRPDSPPKGRIWSCRRDGTDRRLFWEVRDARGESAVPIRLLAHGAGLYLVYSSALLPPPSIEPTPQRIGRGGIVRLHPDRPNPRGASVLLPPEMLRAMQESDGPGMGRFTERIRAEDGSLYVFVTEFRRGVLDFLSTRSTAYGVRSLYRIALPE